MLGTIENINASYIVLTKTDNYFDQLDDNRTINSYDIDSTTVLMLSIRK